MKLVRFPVRRGPALLGTSTGLLGTVEPLAMAIAATYGTSPECVRRVRLHAAALGRAMRLGDDDVSAIELAALLKDIGKLGVPRHILVKPGPLTPDEFQAIRSHSRVAFDILAGAALPDLVRRIVLHHHERWDGRGYPRGLNGNAIPMGARILSTVDYFNALTTDRPYHSAMSKTAALALLRQESGKALDPAVVEAFSRLIPELRSEPDEMPGNGEIKREVFTAIAEAGREFHLLHEIARTFGTALGVADTVALLASKLTAVVPFSTCALFLFDEESDTLRCGFATGVDAELIRKIRVSVGDGVTGWVARNRRALVNGRPGADFEAAGLDPRSSLQSALVCPLVFNDRFIGTLTLYDAKASRFTGDHHRVLDHVCEQAAAVIHNAIAFERCESDAFTDSLTGLPNTRFMFMHLTREFSRAERLRSEVSLIVLDMDGFKQVNERWGSSVADRALRAVAETIRSHIRPHDICVRWMSDKFFVILSGTGVEEAQQKVDELRPAIRRTVVAAASRDLVLAASAGRATFPHDGRDWNELLDMAVKRMRREKHRW